MSSAPWQIRSARPGDETQLCELIRGLAQYERLDHELTLSPASLAVDLFGERPCAEVLVLEQECLLRGYVMYYATYDSYTGARGLWLSDLFVVPKCRGAGHGRALLGALAQLALSRGADRIEWDVLNWNAAAIEFYRGTGAVENAGWQRQRLAGEALKALAVQRA